MRTMIVIPRLRVSPDLDRHLWPWSTASPPALLVAQNRQSHGKTYDFYEPQLEPKTVHSFGPRCSALPKAIHETCRFTKALQSITV